MAAIFGDRFVSVHNNEVKKYSVVMGSGYTGHNLATENYGQ